MKLPPPLEHQEQSAFFEMVYRLEDRYPALKLCFCIPNGSHKSPSQRMKFKREGLRAGVADVFVSVPVPVVMYYPKHHGLWLEFKRKGNKQQIEQQKFQLLVEEQGFAYKVVYTAEEAWAALRDYLKPVCDLPEFK